MKRAVNLRLEENMILTLDQLASELNTTKTDIIERALRLFSHNKQKNRNDLLQFAGILKGSEADNLLRDIREDKNSKDLELYL